MDTNNNMYDVGIYGLWYGRNYGSISTYYALKTIVENLGYTTVMIENPLNSDSLDIDSLCLSHPRRFARNHYEITPRFRLDEMYQLNDICRGFLLGSDQMWNYGLSKAYKQSYFLDFAKDERVKIAYATSFGKSPYNGPASEKTLIRRNLSRFTGVSVRDDFSQKIICEEIGLKAEQVIDPVFLCPRNAYESLIHEVDELEYEDFIFAYILDPSKEIGDAIKSISEKSNKTVLIAFDESSNKKEMQERLGVNDEKIIILQDPPINVWMSCFQKADYVLTDSFHGVCFSTIFEKQFIVLKNNKRGGARFDFLLQTLGLSDRIIETPDNFINKYFETSQKSFIDYHEVANKIQPERERGLKWLKTHLSKIKSCDCTSKLFIKKCVGCGACVSICPKEAVKLQADSWGYYRAEVDYEECINCGKCTSVCPVLNKPVNNNLRLPDCFEFVSSDNDVLMASSSGGVFSTLAKTVLHNKGVVIGAAWQDDLSVAHIIINNKTELWKLQKSKYLQSYMGNTFYKVKQILESGKQVLFTGTPCQAAGLRGYLGSKTYDNLLIVDILCSNAPSSSFFKKYIDDTYPENIAQYEFRYKSDTAKWDCVHTKARLKDGSVEIHNGIADDNYQRVFHNHTMCPQHCENCLFQSFPRMGDLTIGDFWGITKNDPELDVSKGVSLVLCNNDHGRRFFESISIEDYAVKKPVPLEWMGGNGYSRNGGHNFASPYRDRFYDAILIRPFGEAVNYALKPNRGLYRKAYDNSNAALLYDVNMLHFLVEKNVWEELCIDGKPTLIVKNNKWKENGHYARLNLTGMLKKNTSYRIASKFKIKSESAILNFHIIDSGSKQNQLIHTERIIGKNDGLHWIEFSDIFTPNTDYYDQFMFGAAQVSGDNNYLMIAYISIVENVNKME